MAKNQLHGKVFEKTVLASLGVEQHSGNNAIFDIPLEVDKVGSIPGGIKTAKLQDNGNALIYLSDAMRIWNIEEFIKVGSNAEGDVRFRLVIGTYRQEEGEKHFVNIHDMTLLLNDAVKQDLYGNLNLSDIFTFHNLLKSEFFKDPERARVWAERHKEKLQADGGMIKLNYKIDSKHQRRLQCSIDLNSLLAIKDKHGLPYSLHTKEFNGVVLPLRIDSSTREMGAISSVGLSH